MDLRQPRRRLNFFGCRGFVVEADVVGNRAGEKCVVLT
jgi:hypothetical protein